MGLKAHLKSWISVDIVNFLLINILLRHIKQKLLSALSSIEWFPIIGPRASRLAWRFEFLSISIVNFSLVNIFLKTYRVKFVQCIEFYRLISKNRPKGLKTRLESQISVNWYHYFFLTDFVQRVFFKLFNRFLWNFQDW